MNSDLNSEIKKNIMIRVRSIHLMRKFYKPAIYLLLSVAFISSVDVVSVVSNFLSSFESSGTGFGFFKEAFSNSMLAVKLLIIAEALVVLMALRDTVDKLMPRRSII